MDLLYFLKILLRRKWIITGLTFLAVLTAFILKLFQKPLYESKAQYSTGFTIDRVKIAEGSPVADLFAADTKFENVIETFKSPRVIGMISYRLLLHDLENPGGAWHKLSEDEKNSKIYKSLNTDTIINVLNNKIEANELLRSDLPRERDIIEYLKLYKYDYFSILDHLFINRVSTTDFLDIVYRAENPYLSAWLVNAMGNEFLNYYKTLNLQRTSENVNSIRDLERRQQQKIDSLNNKLLAVKISQGSIDPASLSASAMETVKDLEGKLADEKSTYELNNNRIVYLTQTLNSLKNRAGATNTSNSELMNLIDQKNKLEAQLIAKGGSDALIEQELKSLRVKINAASPGSGLTSKNADKIADIQNQIDEATAMKNAASATMNDYTSRIAYYKGLTTLNPGSGVRMEVIQSQLDIEQKQLANLKEKLNQAEGLASDDPTTNFTQTLVGQPAVEPEPKKTITTMGISGMSMFFFTCFAFLFVEVFNSSIKTPYGFEKACDLPLGSVINNLKSKKIKLNDAILNEQKLKPDIESFKNNIRKLRFDLMETNGHVFLFTSTTSGVGKSFLIEALALSFVLIRKKVLIIDFNLHNNSLTRKFNVESTVQQLNHKVNFDSPNVFRKFISVSQIDNVDIIGCNETSSSPSEILYQFDFSDFLRKMKEWYDYVLIETSSLDYTDAKELIRYTDKVVPVFSADQTINQGDNLKIEYLKEIGNKCTGAILNNVLTGNLNF